MGPSCLDVSRAASSFKSGKDLGGQNFDGEDTEAGDLGHGEGGHMHGLRDIQTQVFALFPLYRMFSKFGKLLMGSHCEQTGLQI